MKENIEEKDWEKELQQLKRMDERFDFLRSAQDNLQPGKTPYVLKDAICKEGSPASAGSEIIEDYRPVFDATVVQKLDDRGFTFMGKTSQDEFGFGTFCLNTATNDTRNALDDERVAGGSSGGAAVAVKAADFPLISLGESTGGSISNPAAYNGTIGLTPTYGRVSRDGLISYANSLDKIGVLAEDIDLIHEALVTIAGKDEGDQTTVDKELPDSPLEKLDRGKIAVPEQMVENEGIQKGVRENFQKSQEQLEELGFEVEKVDAPMLDPDIVVPAYYIVAMSEASTNLSRYSGMRYGKSQDPEEYEDFREYFKSIRSENFGEEAKRRVMIGTYIRKEGYRDKYYRKAAQVRTKVINQFKELFENYDFVMAPTMPNIAPKVEEAEALDPVEVYAMDALTVAPNFAGIPMISLPNGESGGMPTGLHLMADHFEEKKLLDMTHTLDGEIESYRRRWEE